MPSPSSQRRTSNRPDKNNNSTKSSPVDVGNPLGPYDTNTVRDRVRQWQSQGGGVVTASDIYVEDYDDKVTCEPHTPKTATTREPARRVEAGLSKSADSKRAIKRSGRQTVKVDTDEHDRSRSASAPRKRVVSDTHWRKKKSPPKKDTSSKASDSIRVEALPDDGIRVSAIPSETRVLPDDGIRVRAIPEAPGKAIPDRPSPEISNEKRSRITNRADKTLASTRKTSNQLGSPKDKKLERYAEDLNEHRRTYKVTVQLSPEESYSEIDSQGNKPRESLYLGSPVAKETARNRHSYHGKSKTSDRSPGSDQGAFIDNSISNKSYKGGILSQVFGESKKMFSRVETVPIATPRVPSIEAWLSETPDPFMDENLPPVEIPAPLRSVKKRRKETEEIKTEDPNKIWKALDAKDGPNIIDAGGRRRRRIRSSALYEDNPFPESLSLDSPLDNSSNGSVSAAKLVDLVTESPESFPRSLHRSGARRDTSTPTKDRRKSMPSKESYVVEEDISVVSSTNTKSSVEPADPLAPLRPPGLNLRRPFPSTGKHRLSTIASVETFNTREQGAAPSFISDIPETMRRPKNAQDEGDDLRYEATDQFDPNGLARRSSKHRLAKHSDLISVLSLPMGRSRSIQSARSIRTNRSRLANATIADLMAELSADEAKYMRELRTLVDGVIPVLLTCVLSKSDSAVAAGLFSRSANSKNDPYLTKPIVDMGIALERLKSLHKRVPQQDPDALLTWAQGAQRVYSEYLRAWRMGFQDVVVNLATSSEIASPNPGSPTIDDDGLDGGLPRNGDGDVVDTNGERVDVAYLLKRPLVRLKYLAKTLKGINFVKPSTEADALAVKYQNLVIDARNRSNEERARLEDEAASNIDPTRARDPRTLGPLAGVTIDRARRVRARDYFNLAFHHSSGQKVDCRVELLIRDDAPDVGTSGDLLICEVDGTGRWLLLPPVQFGRVSARNGDFRGEIIVMVRGFHGQGQGQEWHELLSLTNDDEQVGFEWVQMLGLVPVPSKIMRSQSFMTRHERTRSLIVPKNDLQLPITPQTPVKSRTPSPREIEVPIGERASAKAKTWNESIGHEVLQDLPISPPARERTRLQKKAPASPVTPGGTSRSVPSPSLDGILSLPSSRTQYNPSRAADTSRSPKSLNEALRLAGTSASGLKRTAAKRRSRHADDPDSPKSPDVSTLEHDLREPPIHATEAPKILESKAASPRLSTPPFEGSHVISPAKPSGNTRPFYHRSRSSAPSLELPIIPKVRKESPPPTPADEHIQEPEWPAVKVEEEVVPKTPARLAKKRPANSTPVTEKPPPTPVHRSPSPIQPQGTPTPDLGPASAQRTKRRSSSPLKHEYEPSTASESSSDSDASTIERNEATSVSDSSEDEELEDGDAPTPLIPLSALQRLPKLTPQESLYSLPNGTLSPSQSASQAPFKRVPSQPSKASKTIASIFYWSDKGSWQDLHPDECSIVVTPGLIEAFEMSAAHSQSEKLSSASQPERDTTSPVSTRSSSQASDPQSPRPLIALELTPLVPIRRGTALDISIRSPPTSESKITAISNNNIMFRSRNPEECEALYALINHARINNPTYIALQNARVTSSFTPSFDRSHSTRGGRSSSWFGLGGHNGRSSYRASSAPTPSISMSDSSIASMSSAFSALKRFGRAGAPRRFSIARSTVTSRHPSRANSVYTSSDNSSGSGTSTPLPSTIASASSAEDASKGPATATAAAAAAAAGAAGPIGLSNAKIRLYIRETASKWRDLGSARLTIMRPTNATHPLLVPGTAPSPSPHKQSAHVTAAPNASDKRIVVIGKAKEETLLDVTLGESCFERVARTGIAVSVWEAFEGGAVQKEGGVVGGRLRVFMIQMKSEAETAYTFSIVGKLRY